MEPNRLKFEKSMDFDQFIDTVYALLETVWGKNWGTFTITKPTTSNSKDVNMPQIVYSLNDIKPGLVGPDRREIKPRRREVLTELSALTGEQIQVEIKGLVLDFEVEFFIYADNNREVIQLTRSFRKVLETYKGLLMGNGMRNMWFQKEYQRNTEENAQDKLASRGLIYNVQLEELFRIEHGQIEEITILMQLAMNEMELNGDLPSQEELTSEIIKTIVT